MLSDALAIYFFFFFFNDRPPTEIYPLPLHDALPIWVPRLHAVACGHHVPGEGHREAERALRDDDQRRRRSRDRQIDGESRRDTNAVGTARRRAEVLTYADVRRREGTVQDRP